MKPDYGYQKSLINESYQSLKAHKKVVLAACPGAGKTVMGIQIIKKFLRDNPKSKVLILAHGQTILREQWISQIKTWAKEYPFSQVITDKDIDLRSKIYVAIPQSYRLLLNHIKNIDLLVIDEAHHYYSGELIKKIKGKFIPKNELLLTGTPSAYISNKEWKVIGITLQELMNYKAITDPTIELIESKYDFSLSHYTSDMNLVKSTQFNEKKTIQSLEKVLDSLLKKLNVTKLKYFPKTMIVCSNQKQAKYIYKYLNKKKESPLLSISDPSLGNDQIDLFKSDESYRFLIVVNRGVLGFDFPRLSNVIDFTESLNVNRLFQLFCRIVRKDPFSPTQEKFYLKLTSKSTSPICYYVMSFVVALSDPRYYFTYSDNKKERSQVKIPVNKEFINEVKKYRYNPGQINFPKIPTIDMFRKYTQSNDEYINTIAYTNLSTVRGILYSEKRGMNLEKVINEIKQYQSRGELRVKDSATYQSLCKYYPHVLDQVFGPSIYISKHTIESALEVAKKATIYKKFLHTAAYQLLKNENKLHLAEPYLAKLRKKIVFRSDDEIITAAKESHTASKFWKSAVGRYTKRHKKEALVRSILNAKTNIKRPALTLDIVIQTFKSCTRREFYKTSDYKWASEKGLLSEVYKHDA